MLLPYSVQCWPRPPSASIRYEHDRSNLSAGAHRILRLLTGHKACRSTSKGACSGCHGANAGTTKDSCAAGKRIGSERARGAAGDERHTPLYLNVSPAREIFSTWCRRLHNHLTCSHRHRRPFRLPAPASLAAHPFAARLFLDTAELPGFPRRSSLPRSCRDPCKTWPFDVDLCILLKDRRLLL